MTKSKCQMKSKIQMSNRARKTNFEIVGVGERSSEARVGISDFQNLVFGAMFIEI